MPQVTDPALLQELNGPSPAPALGRTIYRTQSKPLPDQRPSEVQNDALTNQGKSIDNQLKQRQLDRGDLGDAASEERKNAGFLRAMLQGHNDFTKTVGSESAPSLVGEIARDTAPDLSNRFGVNSPERQQLEQAKMPFIRGLLRIESGAAIGPSEFENADREFFPQPGDGADVIEQKRIARVNAIKGMRLAAGILSDDVVDDLNANRAAEQARQPDLVGGVQRGSEIEFGPQGDGPFNRADYLTETFGITPQNEQAILGFFNANRGNQSFSAENVNKFYEALGVAPPAGEDLNRMVQQTRKGDKPFGPIDTSDAEAQRRQELEGRADRVEELTGEAGLGDRAASGGTLGMSDEISGGVGAISALFSGEDVGQGYRDARDTARVLQDRADNRTGLLGDAVEIGAGLAIPAGTISNVGQAARVGAGFGAAGGFGYGEGAAGSTLGAISGAAIGGAVGGGLQRAGQAIVNRAANRSTLAAQARTLQDAGQAEGVTVNRAMADPRLSNRVTAVDASPRRGADLQQGMQEVSGQIESRVGELAPSSGPLDREGLGESAQDALERVREVSGTEASALYTRAEKLAGDVTIIPEKALAKIDEHIAEVTSRGKKGNAKLIKFLQDKKADLSQGGAASINKLRSIRSDTRGQINERNLTATDAERRMVEVGNALSDDIAEALDDRALGAFNNADRAWRERHEFIKQVERQLVGGDASNPISGDAAGRKIESWMRGDGRRLGKFWASLDNAERDVIASSVAAKLGRNNNRVFTADQFVKQVSGDTRALSDRSVRTIFGENGLKSIKNLKVLSEQVARVQGAMNSRKSGSGVAAAGDYGSWLRNLIMGSGGLAGYQIGGSIESAAVGAGTAAISIIAKEAGDARAARMLLSPKLTGWMRNAPKTTNPKAIDKHFGQLGQIAKGQPALASEISILQDIIIKAANDNPGRAAAQDGESPDGR